MQYSKGISKETSEARRNQAGVYRHPDTGAEEVLLEHPVYGTASIDGYVRVGFVRVGDVPANYLRNQVKRVEMPEEAPAKQGAPAPSDGPLNIDDYSRKQLEAMALEAGVENPGDTKVFTNKQSLADAIAAKKGNE